MNAKENAYWQAYRTTVRFFSDETEIIDAFDVLKEDVASFKSLVEAIETNLADSSSLELVSGSEKSGMKKQLALQTSGFLLKLKAHAIKSKNDTLLEACQISVSNMLSLGDDDFNRLMMDVVGKLTTYAQVLQKYNVKESDRLAFAAQTKNYEQLLPKMKVMNSKAVVQAGNLSDLIKQTKEFVENVLNVAVESVRDEFPDFVKEYNEVITGRLPSVNNTQVIFKVIDATTQTVLKNVSIDMEENNKNFKTDDDGRCVVKTGKYKDVTFKLSMSGYNTQTITVTKLMRGRNRDVTVNLVREAVVEVVSNG